MDGTPACLHYGYCSDRLLLLLHLFTLLSLLLQ
jgi:hypothetical protein